ncbi:MAG: hypothetical protein R3E08_02695 [Thiotrichaceae bacterium]
MQTDSLYADIEYTPLYQFTEQAYLDYAMYDFRSRFLPHIADGLKPGVTLHYLCHVRIGTQGSE